MPDNVTDTTGSPPTASFAAPADQDQQPPLDLDAGDAGDAGDGDAAPAKVDRSKLMAERKFRKAAEKRVDDLTRELEARDKRLKEFEDRDKTEDQRRTEALEAARSETAEALAREKAALLKLLKHEIGIRKGLRPKQVHRLVGETEEELEADADRLLEEMAGDEETPAPPARPRPDRTLGRGETTKQSTSDQFAAAIGPLL